MPLPSDPATVLQALGVVCIVAALAFGAGARFCGLSPVAATYWAVANLLFANGSFLTVWREGLPSPALYTATDTLELMGLAALYSGFVLFLKQPPPWRECLAVVVAAGLGMLITYTLGQPVSRLLIYCGAAAWLLGRNAWVAFHGLRAEFNRRAAWIVAAPMAVACGLQVLRGLGGAFYSDETAHSIAPNTFNVLLLWAGFVVALSLNAAVAGFVGARQVARIHALTLTDPLTSALNRRALEMLLGKELARRNRHGRSLSIVYFDLDHFKALNDRHGHAAGDAALRHVASVARAGIRGGDELARVGGEEFCLVLPFTPLEGACLMAERIRSAFEMTPLLWQGQRIAVTGSFGVACAPPGTEADWLSLLDRGDQAMYVAKMSGRNCVATDPLSEPVPAAA